MVLFDLPIFIGVCIRVWKLLQYNVPGVDAKKKKTVLLILLFTALVFQVFHFFGKKQFGRDVFINNKMFVPKFSTCYDPFMGALIRNSFQIIGYSILQYLATNFKQRGHI